LSEASANANPSKLRPWLARAAVAFAVLSLLIALAGFWLLRTPSGRDFALERVKAVLPPGALSWERAEGTFGAGLAFDGLRYAADGVDAQLQRAEVRIEPRALWTRELHVWQLMLANGKVVLPPPAPSGPLVRIELPAALPTLELPLAVQLDSLQLHDVQVLREITGRADDEPLESLIELRSLDAIASLRDGRLAVTKLVLDSDRLALDAKARIDSAANWKTTLDAEAKLALGEDLDSLPMQLQVRGDLSDLRLQLDTDTGEPASLSLQLVGGLPDPRWTLDLAAPKLLPERFGASGEALALQLQGSGDRLSANLSGVVEQGKSRFELAPSSLRYDDATLELAPLALKLDRGAMQASGRIALDGAEPRLALDLSWNDVTLPAQTPEMTVASQGRARIEGPLSDYALTLQGQLVRGGDRATLALQGRGSTEALTVARLESELPRGRLDASGRFVWSPALTWKLDATLREFDPSWFAPDYPGAVDAAFASEGGIGDKGPFGTLALRDLSGQLRGRALDGRVDAAMDRTGKGRGHVAMQIGGSKIDAQGTFGDALDLRAGFSPLDLADVLPGVEGRLRGSVVAKGKPDKPDLRVRMAGRGIAQGDTKLTSLRIDADISALDRGRAEVEAKGLIVGGGRVDIVSVSADGSRAKHRAILTLRGEPGELGLELSGGQAANGDWRGLLSAFDIGSPQERAWKLREPAAVSYAPSRGAYVLASACIASGEAALCVDAKGQGSETDGRFALEKLDLAPFGPWIAEALGQTVAIRGLLDAEGEFTHRADGRIQARFNATSSEVDLRRHAKSPRRLLALSDLKLAATLDPQRAHLDLHSIVDGDGRIEADVALATPMEADGALSGTLDLDLPNLGALVLFTDQLADPKGRIEGRIVLSGTRDTPGFEGGAKLHDFSADVPELGIALEQGEIALSGRSGGTFDLEGTVKLGEGIARLSGTFDPMAQDGMHAQLGIVGTDLAVMGTPDIHLVASPDLRLELVKGRLKVRGNVEVPSARIDLEQLQSAVAPSSDVVIVDAETASESILLDLDVGVKLGSRVRMRGYGLNGRLGGQLQLRQTPGKVMTARGGIDVGGSYKAYGQDLSIVRGNVSFASSPLDNPALDIRAQRKIDDVTVGIQVRGTALSPSLELWSQPAMEQAEQLSYLVLGKPLRSASQADGGQLTQAAAAFGGNLLAKKLGARMGLDDVEVADNRALGGAALTVGKHISPRMYVAYGVALFGTGQVVTFKYLLNRMWNVQIDSGSENRAALNYRIER